MHVLDVLHRYFVTGGDKILETPINGVLQSATVIGSAYLKGYRKDGYLLDKVKFFDNDIRGFQWQENIYHTDKINCTLYIIGDSMVRGFGLGGIQI